MRIDKINEDDKRLLLPEKWRKLDAVFYTREDVVLIAKELLGKILVSRFDNVFTAGRITETEAYAGVEDKASHAFGGKRTGRTETMYASGGVAYIYLCYGLHYLFNAVTNVAGTPHAVLIRALEPLAGIENMLLRTGKIKADYTLTKGPGNVCKAMGITAKANGYSLLGNDLFIAADDFVMQDSSVVASERIGVAYAGADANLPYRFNIKNSFYVSGKTKFLVEAAG